MPACLQAAATRRCVARWGEIGRRTPLTTIMSGEMVVMGMVLVGAALFVGMCMLIVASYAPHKAQPAHGVH